MKWGIYIILLANIGFFVWHFQATEISASGRPSVEKDPEDGAVRLVMLKEYVEQQDVQAKAEAKPEKWCYSLGPFKQQQQVKQIEGELINQGFPVQTRTDTEARKKGYWVFLEPVRDYKAARKLTSELKKKHKIKDLFIVTTGEKKNGISLGVFSRFELAYRRQNEINKLGYRAQVEDVKLPTKEYWLDWPREYEQELSDEMLEMAQKLANTVSRVERGCQIK